MTTLDDFNSDLHLVIDKDGFAAQPLTKPTGFCLMWAGARATHGVCSGRAYFEVEVMEHLSVDFGEVPEEDPYVVRVGWSIDSSPLQLGVDKWSYGYGGTGMFSNNNRFSPYGESFGVGDVIGATVELEKRCMTITFTKNGQAMGVALKEEKYPVGQRHKALFPHVLSKNCRFRVNFGNREAKFPPPAEFPFIDTRFDKVRGMLPPAKFSDCEVMMLIGLPGAGKTTWALNLDKSHPEKRYNILGTDQLMERMKVKDIPRRGNFAERYEILIDKATKCINELLQISGKKKRNYILDQTNVFASARRKKMNHFNRFYKVATVIQPEDVELMKRSAKRTGTEGKVIPLSVVMDMKANYALPQPIDSLFSRIDYAELPRDKCVPLVRGYNKEGQQHASSRRERGEADKEGSEKKGPHDKRYQRARVKENKPEVKPAEPEEDEKPSTFGGSWGFWQKPTVTNEPRRPRRTRAKVYSPAT